MTAIPVIERVPALWFSRTGAGPSELALELHPFPAEKDGRIPAWLGLRVRAAGLCGPNGAELVDGGFNLGREQVEQLHQQLGAWLAANPATTEPT